MKVFRMWVLVAWGFIRKDRQRHLAQARNVSCMNSADWGPKVNPYLQNRQFLLGFPYKPSYLLMITGPCSLFVSYVAFRVPQIAAFRPGTPTKAWYLNQTPQKEYLEPVGPVGLVHVRKGHWDNDEIDLRVRCLNQPGSPNNWMLIRLSNYTGLITLFSTGATYTRKARRL